MRGAPTDAPLGTRDFVPSDSHVSCNPILPSFSQPFTNAKLALSVRTEPEGVMGPRADNGLRAQALAQVQSQPAAVSQ